VSLLRAADDFWHARRRPLLLALCAAMAVCAAVRLGFAFARLVFNYQNWANIDLRIFYRLVDAWFAGQPVVGSAYPPASFVLLWPLLGWLDLQGTRWLWAATTIAALAWLAVLLARQARADSGPERVAWMLLPLAAYATSATIGNGQLGIHVLAPLLGGLVMLRERPASWTTDLAAAAMVIFALVKPSISAPFFWIVLLCLARIRPAALVVGGYAALTALAVLLNSGGQVDTAPILQRSVESGVEGLAVGSAELGGGFATINDPLTALGLERWNAVASLVVLALLGLWLFRHRRADPWLLLGVTALVARFWAYHRLHDDVLIFVPLVTLGRLAREDDGSVRSVSARALLVVLWLSTLVPAGLLFAPWPWDLAFEVAQAAIWAVVLVYLARRVGPTL